MASNLHTFAASERVIVSCSHRIHKLQVETQECSLPDPKVQKSFGEPDPFEVYAVPYLASCKRKQGRGLRYLAFSGYSTLLGVQRHSRPTMV